MATLKICTKCGVAFADGGLWHSGTKTICYACEKCSPNLILEFNYSNKTRVFNIINYEYSSNAKYYLFGNLSKNYTFLAPNVYSSIINVYIVVLVIQF